MQNDIRREYCAHPRLNEQYQNTIREAVKKNLIVADMSLTFWPPPPRHGIKLFGGHRKNLRVFLVIVWYVYMEIQNGLKRMILKEKILNNLKSFQIHIFTFEKILHLFPHQEKNTYLVADRGLTPPPPPFRLRTYPQLLGFFYAFPYRFLKDVLTSS